jgi:hypothetical protein
MGAGFSLKFNFIKHRKKFQLNQTTDKKDENNNCLNKLNELKFCEVSWNWTGKFQLSILKNKKVLFLKKKILSRTAKIDPKDGISRLNFPEGFVSLFKNQGYFLHIFAKLVVSWWPSNFAF